MKQITIDGDRFTIDIPDKTLWTGSFVLMAKKEKRWKDGFNTILFSDKHSKTGHLARTDFAPYVWDTPVEYRSGIAGWRPVLIPDKPMADLDGTVTTGGTFYLNGAPQSLGEYAPLAYQGTRSDLDIGDTVIGKELSWLVWKGWLVCTDVLVANITTPELRELRYGDLSVRMRYC